MKLHVSLLVLLGLAIVANPAAQAANPAASVVSPVETVDTRLYWDTLGTSQDELIDTRLYLLIRSLAGAKIDTLTNPGTLLLIK
jgi:hypothetical protein